MKPKFQENTEINKEKTKESEERQKKFFETGRRSASKISSIKFMHAFIMSFSDINSFEKENNKSKE